MTARIKGVSWLLLIGLSLMAWWYFSAKGLSLSYNDAMSHLNLSRLVVDNIEPGVSQIGGVWLPMNHLLPIVLIWNDWAWRSGFAGSVFSMIAYVVSTWGVFQIVKTFTGNRWGAVVGALAFALNINMLYLQSTPLTEPLYVVFFVLSVLALTRYLLTSETKYLLALSIVSFFQVLTRYDGWFVVMIELLIIAFHKWFVRKESWEGVLGRVVLFFTPIAFGIGLWLLWNLIIFKDPLYFALGPFSAHSQQNTISQAAGLVTKGQIGLSIRSYGLAVLDNIGSYVLALSVGGLVTLFWGVGKLKFYPKVLILLMLSSPILFNILTLYLGFSILSVPEMGVKVSDPTNQWFNVRYGILALPMVAVMLGLYGSKGRFFGVLIVAILLFQMVVSIRQGIVTVVDGTVGTSSFRNDDVAQVLSQKVRPSERVIMSMSFFNPVAFRSGLKLEQVIHEGVAQVWSKALNTPERYANWIVMPKGDIGEAVYSSLVNQQRRRFLSFYSLEYVGVHADVYRLKRPEEMFVSGSEGRLRVGEVPVSVSSVNVDDLAYLNDLEIADKFADLKSRGVNVVRFGVFGEGRADGFQPRVGVANESRFGQVDRILLLARRYNMRVVPVLTTGRSEFGGWGQYLSWVGINGGGHELFFSNPAAKSLFKNYLNLVVSHKNSLTRLEYRNEPTILGWEVIDQSQIQRGNQAVLNGWREEMATYLHQLDNNHLVLSDERL